MLRLSGLSLFLFLLASCGSDRLDVDVSGIELAPVKITRFDKAVFGTDTVNLEGRKAELEKQYGDFYAGYTERIICPGTYGQPICHQQFVRFITDPDMFSAWQDVQKKYADLAPIEKEIEEAYRHFKYHFPQRKTPAKIHAMMSGFNFNFLQISGEYGIGLEMYLGSDASYYSAMQLPLYRRSRMDRPYIVSDYVHAWMTNEFPLVDEKGDLLTRMIYEGKLLYLAQALMPATPDTIRFGYSAKQLAWAEANEANAWAYMIEKKWLYSTNEADIFPMVNDGPFTTGFSHDSPPRMASYIGYKIVRAYMDNNSSADLETLMKLTDAQTLLNRSKYKPKF